MTITDSRPAIARATTNVASPDAPNSRPTKHAAQPNGPASGGPASPAARQDAATIPLSPQGTQSTGRHGSVDTHSSRAAGSNVPDPAVIHAPMSIAASLLDPALCLAADILDDIERVRIANENRLRQLTRSELDIDGEERGFGLDPDHPDVMRLGIMIETLKRVEHDAVLGLQAKMRKHPLGGWVKAQRGVGLKQGARLLAAIGDPYINSANGQPRTVSALWAYAGLHVLPVEGLGRNDTHGRTALDGSQLPAGHDVDGAHVTIAAGDQTRDADPVVPDAQCNGVGVAAKRRRGERANWSTKAKTRAHLIAESCIKQLSPGCREGHAGPVAQSNYAHEAAEGAGRGGQCPSDAQSRSSAPACACSPYRVVYDIRRAHTASTRPEWTDGHSHNDALRVTSKEILKDLWRAAREWHLAEANPRG